MKAYVYTDASLERGAGRFVWLSLNTERAANAPFLKRYPIPALPAVLILDPAIDEVILRFMGGMTVPQLRKLLDDAERTHRTRVLARADGLLIKADRLAATGKRKQAVEAYEDAIASAPRKWPPLGRAAESLVIELSLEHDSWNCAKHALDLYPRLKGTPSAATVAATGLSCSIALDASHRRRNDVIRSLETATREAFDDPAILISDDDRSSLYIAMAEAREDAGDLEEAIALKVRWAAFLEDAAARAKTPEQRTVFDSHRISAYLDLNKPEKAIPMLEQSQRDFPDDYNPPARLAIAWKALGDYDKALAASDRALALVYGPRKLTVLSVRADIFAAKGDANAAKETIVQAIGFARSLPESQRSASRIAAFEKRLAEMK